MVLGLAGLWARRFLVDRVRYISTPSDHLMLALLIAIGLTGLGMKLRGADRHRRAQGLLSRPDVLRLAAAAGRPAAADLHLPLVALLMIIFPISKLLHAPGVFFSPTRNQVDNPREKRHVAGLGRRARQNQAETNRR